ncbi:MAG: aminopeptidase [Spirochaetales bacterium]|nr:aminopeptidase [Spirochaetales bacterium]
MDKYENYAKTIINDLLGLRVGDALSINTDERDVEFAKTIARLALPVTDVTVKIVVIEKGKPVQVLEFDPTPPAHLPTGFAMLRLAHKERKKLEGKLLDVVVEPTDMGAIQKMGHLAEPVVLGRRIAVPWCVADVYDDEDSAWDEIERKISFNIANLGLVSLYRAQKLNDIGIVQLKITGEGTDLAVDVPAETLFHGGHHELASGRQFLSGMDFDTLNLLVDRKSADGCFTANVEVFGKPQRICFGFSNGVLKSYSHSPELERLLSFDEDIRRVGYISLSESGMYVNLGGAPVDALRILPATEDDLPGFFNKSLYTLRCRLSGKHDVLATGSNGIDLEIMRDGMFVE